MLIETQHHKKGFTLLELMIVIVILGILATVVMPRIMDRPEQARRVKAVTEIRLIETALSSFKVDTGRYPTSQEGLDALVQAPSGIKMWDGPYMKKMPKDAWQNEFQYSGPGKAGESDYEVASGGVDGVRGGDDDISSND